MAPGLRSLSFFRRTDSPIALLTLCLLVLLVLPAAAAPIVETSPETGNVTVFDPNTLQPIPQFPATDGGAGKLNTILWALFGIALGIPLGVLGIRGGRLTTGAAVGFVGTVTIWAAFVNALPMPLAATPNTADLILTIILIASFAFLTFLGAFLRFLHPLGIGLLGATGGTSLLMRLAIFKRDLLLPLRLYPLDLALLGFGALLGVILIIWKRRPVVMLATALIATFLLGLAVDLLVNIDAPPAQGMRRGLKLLMDRNPAHLADVLGTPYAPAVATQVILGVSLALVPVFVYTQHRLFPGPFVYTLRRRELEESELGSLYDGPDFSAGRPLALQKARVGVDMSRMAISGPMFGPVGHGSRFST